MPTQWTADDILRLAGGYQVACVLTAAADLDLFNQFAGVCFTAAEAALRLGADSRATATLLDALVAQELLDKSGDRYSVPPAVAALLTDKAGGVLAMVRHQGNCMRRWAQLAAVVRSGQPAARVPSVRGADADYAAFIEAMDNISGPVADRIVADIPPLPFQHLLDVGGASGTWTLAFLRANSSASATIFDLPQVQAQAERRIAAEGPEMARRVRFVAGDFYKDPLPDGADLAWVSAIVHQHGRQENRQLFAAVHRALRPGGHLLIRDILMDESRTRPVGGAMFAINMLVATATGGTFTVCELRQDLESTGFGEVQVVRRDPWMNSVMRARKTL